MHERSARIAIAIVFVPGKNMCPAMLLLMQMATKSKNSTLSRPLIDLCDGTMSAEALRMQDAPPIPKHHPIYIAGA